MIFSTFSAFGPTASVTMLSPRCALRFAAMAVPSILSSTKRYVVISSEKEKDALNRYLATTFANVRIVITIRQAAASISSILSNIRILFPPSPIRSLSGKLRRLSRRIFQ